MGSMDAKFNPQIFRKDNPIILACRRDKAVFMGARIVPDGNDYLPGQCLVRYNSGANNGLFGRWSAASGSSYDSPCVLFDQSLYVDQEAESPASGGVLVRVLTSALVYSQFMTDFDTNFATQLKSKTFVDSGGNSIITF